MSEDVFGPFFSGNVDQPMPFEKVYHPKLQCLTCHLQWEMQASSRDRRGRFFPQGRARPKIYGAGRGSVLNLQGGADTIFQKPVKNVCYSRGNLNLHLHILNIHNHGRYYDHNHCSIFSHCFIMDFLNCESVTFNLPRHCPTFFTIFAGRGRAGCFTGWGGPSIPGLRTIFDAFALFTEQNIITNYSEVLGHLLSVES